MFFVNGVSKNCSRKGFLGLLFFIEKENMFASLIPARETDMIERNSGNPAELSREVRRNGGAAEFL